MAVNRKFKEIIGELGEIIQLYTPSVKADNEEVHIAVGFEIDGFTTNEDGTITLILSPNAAKALASEIIKVADNANTANYNLLTHKAPL